jgi:LysM repeat protein
MIENGYSKYILLFYAFTLFSTLSFAQKRITVDEYISQYKKDAIKDMHKSGVPASITLAQAILESECGNSDLAKKSKNHFGIKCHTEWKGKTFKHDDDKKQECFRKYNDVLDSYEDHSDFLRTRSRYNFLFDIPMDDYKAWASGLKKAGYATNPKYPEMLIKIIEDNKLYELVPGGEQYAEPIAISSVSIAQVSNKKTGENEKLIDTPLNAKYQHSTPEWSPSNRTISYLNKIKYVIVKKEDSYFSIAAEYHMGLWQVYKYNDADKDDELVAGEKVYLAPKGRKASGIVTHVVKKGETMRSISQEFAIKVKRLYKFNNMKKGNEPVPGETIYLQKHK